MTENRTSPTLRRGYKASAEQFAPRELVELGVRAEEVVVAGDLEGNIESAQRVELLDTSALTGDLKAGTLTVASGAKIRGRSGRVLRLALDGACASKQTAPAVLAEAHHSLRRRS